MSEGTFSNAAAQLLYQDDRQALEVHNQSTDSTGGSIVSECRLEMVLNRDLRLFHLTLNILGPVVQSVVSLTSSLRVISLTVLADSDRRPGGRGFNPRRGRQHSFVEIDHEIFSTVILSLPLIQEGQLSVSGERMCTILVNRLED